MVYYSQESSTLAALFDPGAGKLYCECLQKCDLSVASMLRSPEPTYLQWTEDQAIGTRQWVLDYVFLVENGV